MLAEYLSESGLISFVIDEHRCLGRDEEAIDIADEKSMMRESEELVFDRLLVNERTLLSILLLSLDGMTQLLNLVNRWRAEPLCLLDLDVRLDAAIVHHRSERKYNLNDDALSQLYAAMGAVDLSSRGLPVVGATALTYAVEGRDDGR